jgi:tetratricopeptide (TPR) repeat protein
LTVKASVAPIDPEQFIAAVQPLLAAMDLPGLHHLLKSRWSAEQIQDLLSSDHVDAKKVALLAVGLVGKGCCVNKLVRHLADPDPVVHEMAEHALWSVWFRGGSDEANHQLARGAQALERRDFDHAVCHFDRALALSPDFAEAYNQRALAHYLAERYETSIADAQRAVELMPIHFGAWAGMGHCHAHLGHPREAIRCYARALSIHPHLTCIRQAVEELRGQAGRQDRNEDGG